MDDFKLEIFKNEKFGEIRVTLKDNKPYFNLKDVCGILGLKNPRDVKTRLNQKGVVISDTPTKSGIQQMNYIDETNLYKCIFRSNKPEAEEFTDWVASEVLPTIRKTGMYMTDNVWDNLMNDPTKFGEMLIEYGKVREENRRLNKTIEEQAPKVDYTEKVLASDNLLTVTQIAKDFGLSARKLNSILSNEKIQFKQGKQWFLYQEYADKGYTKSFTTVDEDGKVYVNTKWTQKGKQFIYDLLIELGYEIVEGK